VDVPSGFGTPTAVEPREVVTFHDRKEGMEDVPYRVVVADIGIPEDASRVVGPGDMLRYPVPEGGSHKGANGRLLAICGGPYFGAPALACRAAMRTGADLVHLCCPQSAFGIAASACPEITGTMLPGTRLTAESVDMLLELSERYDAVLIGPGLGAAVDTLEAIRQFISRCGKPMVIDADAIKVAASMELRNSVLTPHAGEFKALNGPLEAVAGRYGAVLLKGREDRISDGTRTRVNRTGNAGMTCGGTGDVLAGCTAALLSKGMCQFDAACLAAYICGSAGDRAFADKSYGLIASDVIEEIPHVLRDALR
jgi:NAD(P)H-hydrate epimerase